MTTSVVSHAYTKASCLTDEFSIPYYSLDTVHKLKVHQHIKKTNRTSSERLMYIQFRLVFNYSFLVDILLPVSCNFIRTELRCRRVLKNIQFSENLSLIYGLFYLLIYGLEDEVDVRFSVK